MTRAAKFIAFLLAALIFPAILGGAGEAQDGTPPTLLEWPMLAGESLNQLARLIYPGDTAMQKRFIRAAVRENPATFSQFAPNHKFDSETRIWLPDLKALSRYAGASKSPHHFLRPPLPAMHPAKADVQPQPLRMSNTIENKSAANDKDEMAAFEAMVARNEALKNEQQTLDSRIAMLEAAISRIRAAFTSERRPPRRIRHVEAAVVVAPKDDSLLSPSPLHLLTLVGILLTGGAGLLLRRHRSKRMVVVPVMARKSPDTISPNFDLGAPAASSIQIQENFADDLISVDEIESIVEEAKVFVALGRTEYAVEVLEDYITTHPRSSAHPWLYLMEVHRSMQNRTAFEAAAKRFHQAMNVVTPQWESASQVTMVVAHSLEEFPHIMSRLIEGWTKRDAQDFLNHLLQDNRGGERQGFSMEVLQEILLLLAVIELRDHLPPLKPF